MFFFFLDRPRPEMIDFLSKVVTNRDTLNTHVRELHTLAFGQDVESREQSKHLWKHESWSDEELNAVLNNGLDMLSDDRLAWLRHNPIALFEIFDAINEALPSLWMDLVMADAERIWEDRPNVRPFNDNEDTPVSSKHPQVDVATEATRTDMYSGLEDDDEFESLPTTLAHLVTNRDALVEHVRELQRESLPMETDSWLEGELSQVLEEGIEHLPKQRLKRLRHNPIALFELFDAINESLPACWMELVLADAKRLRESRPSARRQSTTESTGDHRHYTDGASRYDHHKKAGNKGDIVKHPALLAAVDGVISAATKDVFRYADTFAAYAWNSLVKGHEWQQGIGRVAGNSVLLENPHTSQWVSRYLEPGPNVGGRYPGSARIVVDVCVQQGADIQMSLWDIASGPVASLEAEFGGENHHIFQRAAVADEPDVRGADFVFIDPPDKNCWPEIREFLKQAPNEQAILVWLPVAANAMTTPPTEDRMSKNCRMEALALPGFRASKVRWAKGGRTIGCQLIYRLPPPALEALRSAIECVVKAADWQDDTELLGAVHYDP